jgi:integrase
MARMKTGLLKETQVRSAQPQEKPYELHDGGGLTLYVHPGGSRTWRLRYVNSTGDRPRVALGKYPDVSLAEARRLAEELRSGVAHGKDPAAERAAAREQGEADRRNTLEVVVREYLETERGTWKASTAATYESAIRRFLAWANANKLTHAHDVTPANLALYKAHAVSLPRHVKKKGGGRHDVVSTDEKRSASAVNADLRATKTMLQTLRKRRQLPGIQSSDDITDNLALLRVDQARPDPLKPSELRQLIAACDRHDREATHEPIGPLVAVMLLSGMRLGEALERLTWADVDLDEQLLRVVAGKTTAERAVDLTVSPALVRLLGALKRSGKKTKVFEYTQSKALDARVRLIADFGAPEFLWSTRHARPGDRSPPTLRSTCGCYLACAPAIFGAASVYRAAAQLGHSVEVAQRHYLGTVRRIPDTARTLESAMKIEDELEPIIERVQQSSSAKLRVAK